MTNDLYRACAEYLKSYDLRRMMTMMKEKYCSYGLVKGNISLQKPTKSERDFLQGLFKKDFSEPNVIKVSLIHFEKAFEGTHFNGIELKSLLEAYFGETIMENKRVVEHQQASKMNALNAIRNALCSEPLKEWIGRAFEDPKHLGYRFVTEWFSDRSTVDPKRLMLQLESLLNLLEHHDEGMPFPLAAAKVTGYPHALDKDKPLRKLLTAYVRTIYAEESFHTLEAQDALYEKVNITSDEIPRMVLTYGVYAYDMNGDTLNWEAFHRRCEPLLVNKPNLRNVSFIKASTEKVRVFENPTAFYQYIYKNRIASAICTHGQLHLVDWMLLDLVNASEATIIYSGDFDPEGLWIAERLKKRYPMTDLSFFSVTRYRECQSEEVIAEKRLKQLSRITVPELKAVAVVMCEDKVAGYEEVY